MEEMLSKLQQELKEAQEEIKNLEGRLDEIAESSYDEGYNQALNDILQNVEERMR